MVRGTQAQISSLVYVALASVLLAIGIPSELIGLSAGGPWWCRLTYQFFHASILHLLTNCWALLCLIFYYEMGPKSLITAFIISALVPIGLFPSSESTVTIGGSGIVFALMGMVSFRVIRKIYFHSWTLGFIGIGFFFSSSNSYLHLFCYAAGVLVRYSEIIWKKRLRPLLRARLCLARQRLRLLQIERQLRTNYGRTFIASYHRSKHRLWK